MSKGHDRETMVSTRTDPKWPENGQRTNRRVLRGSHNGKSPGEGEKGFYCISYSTFSLQETESVIVRSGTFQTQSVFVPNELTPPNISYVYVQQQISKV